MTDNTPEITTGIPVLNHTLNPIVEESFTPVPGESINPLQIWIPILAAVWILGMVVFLVYTAISYFLLKRKVRTAVLLRDIIYRSENVISPFVLGIIKPKIYLPFYMKEQDVVHVVAHEQAHIRRKDHLWKTLGFLLLAINWFNPLMWIGYVLFCRDIELASDEKVVRELDREQRADYAQALLSCSVNRRGIAACPLAFGEVGVKERVKSVLNYKKPAFWLIVAAVMAGVVLAFCFLTNPKTTKDNKNAFRPVYDSDGTYAGFNDIPSGYSVADATADGCLVIDVTTKTNEYGASITEKYETAGHGCWLAFTEASSKEKNAFLRVAHFIDGVGYYSDLYYCDGKYTFFDLNEYGISEGKSYSYLRRLDGYAGPADRRQEDCFYVLTDSKKLTYDDVSWSFLSGYRPMDTDIPFEWLGFMTYFK